MAQYGFLIDLSRCIGCHACMIACKQWHDIAPGPVKWMRVYQWEKGSFPNIDLRVLPLPCLHCEVPVCMEACPNHAIYKEEKFGAVLVDPSKCTGERKCWEACPYGAPQFESDEPGTKMSKCTMCIDRLEQGLAPICVLSCSMRALEFGPIDELMEKFGDAKQKAVRQGKDYAPCRSACPAGVNAEGYIKLLGTGKVSEALELFRETTPFAGVLGRVCAHPCEIDCNRGRFDDAVAICSLKRYMADNVADANRKKVAAVKPDKNEKIAVIGAGPAGLSCAYDLIRKGYPVTVFEASAEAGGLLRYGIPEYRLPKKVLDDEIDIIRELGVDIRLSTRVRKVEDILAQGYSAVFVATGAWKSLRLGIEGEDADGVINALDLLKQVNTGTKVELGQRVAVIGGGSVAIDAARTCVRLGSREVHLICLECRLPSSKDRMLAQEHEIAEAEEEGVIIHNCLGVKKIITAKGKVCALETLSCVSVRDIDGSFNPQYAEGQTPSFEVDNVITAIGQTIDGDMLPEDLSRTPRGNLTVDMLTLQSKNERIFGGGDVVSGPVDVISAVAAGKEAAVSIERYLLGEDLKQGRKRPSPSVRERLEKPSMPSPVLNAGQRVGFNEVARSYDEQTAFEQAVRCLNCGTTVPSVVFKREDPKKQIIPYDAKRALELWQKRHPENGESLPDVFAAPEDIMNVPDSVYGRNRLVLKPCDSEELLFFTTDDE